MSEYDDDEGYDYTQAEYDIYSDHSDHSDEVESDIEDAILSHVHYTTDYAFQSKPNSESDNIPPPDLVNSEPSINVQNDEPESKTRDTSDSLFSIGTDHERLSMADSNKDKPSDEVQDGTTKIRRQNDGDDDSRYGINKTQRKRNTVEDFIAIVSSSSEEDDEEEGELKDQSVDSDLELYGETSKTELRPAETAGKKYSDPVLEKNAVDLSIVEDHGTAGLEIPAESDETEFLTHLVTLGGASDENVERTINDVSLDEVYADLEYEDFKGRNRYFMENEGPRCLRCDERGHTARECTIIKCLICGAFGHEHFKCPFMSQIVCFQCKQRGHRKIDCVIPPEVIRERMCRNCDYGSHLKEDCPKIWRVYIVPDYVDRNRKRGLTISCYNCASPDHYGDDCPRPRFDRVRSINPTPFRIEPPFQCRVIYENEVTDENIISKIPTLESRICDRLEALDMSRNRKRQRHDDEEREDSDRNQHERQIKRPKRQLNRDLERDSAIPGNNRGRRSNDRGNDRRNVQSRRNDERVRSNDDGGDELEEGEFRPRGAGRNDMGRKDGPNQLSDRGDSRNQSPRSDSNRNTESPRNNFNRNSNSNFPRSQRSQDQPRWSKPKIQQKQSGQIKFNFNFGGKGSNDKGNRFGNGQGRNGGSSKGQSGSNNKSLYKGGYNYKK